MSLGRCKIATRAPSQAQVHRGLSKSKEGVRKPRTLPCSTTSFALSTKQHKCTVRGAVETWRDTRPPFCDTDVQGLLKSENGAKILRNLYLRRDPPEHKTIAVYCWRNMKPVGTYRN